MKTVNAVMREIEAPLGRAILNRLSENGDDLRISRVEMNRGNAECYSQKGFEVQRIDPNRNMECFQTFCGYPIVTDYGLPDDVILFRGSHGDLIGMIYNLSPPSEL